MTALPTNESPPLLEKRGTPSSTAVAAAVAIAATALWLCLLDRVGVVLVGGNAWCGPRAAWLMYSCHAATAAPVVAIFFAFRSLAAGGSRGKRIVMPIAGAITGFVALRILFLELPLNNVIPVSVALAMPFVGALLVGLATTLRTTPKGKRWIIGGAGALSIFSGVIDATFFPTLVAATHVRAHAVTIVAAVVGIGLPAGALLSERRGRWVASAVAGATIAAASGIWVTLTAARGLVAAVSPPLARLLVLLPATAPPGVLRLALSAPSLPGASRGARAEPRPGAPSSVILITVDALRADALRPAPGRGSYMIPGDTPFVDRWIAGATWFDNAISQGTSTADTMRSLMRGINSGDEHPAADIPAVAQRLGLRSVAVVPAFLRDDALFQTGIERFERAEFYDQRRQEQQLDLVERVIDELEGDRFFLWTHFFCTHAPYYSLSGSREQEFFIPPTQVGRLAAEYREAVRWLDAQLARMFRALEHEGLRSSTLVVLTADHGEHIGDGLLIGHGDALHESDIRVPLVFDVPEQAAGAVVKALVGSRDVLPTIIEILGGPEEPSHRGESLLPLIQGRAPPAPRVYPVRGVLRTEYGLLTEREILVYSPALGAFQYFLRPPGVTIGSGDGFGRNRATDEALMALLARFEPAPFSAELKDPYTSRLFAERIEALSGNEASSLADALISLAQDANANAPEVQAALRKAFSATPQVETKLKILAGAFARDEVHWGAALVELLLGARGLPGEAALVSAVESLGLAGRVSTILAIFRLAELRGEADRELRDTWLSLLGASPREVELVPELTTLSERIDPRTAEPREVQLLLRAVAALALTPPRASAARLAEWVRPLMDDPRERIAGAACAALGAVGSGEDVKSMNRLAASTRRVVVRRAALRASVRIQGIMAMDSLKVWAGDALLAPTALGQIAQVGDAEALEWAQRELDAESDAFKRELLLQTVVDLQRRLVAPAN